MNYIHTYTKCQEFYIQHKKFCKKIFNDPKIIDPGSFIVYTHSTMYIKLTNATPAHKGTPLAIRKDLVVSVHHNTIVRDDGTVEPVTFLHCPPHGTWEAQDTFDSVVSQLNGTVVADSEAKPKRSTRVKADPA